MKVRQKVTLEIEFEKGRHDGPASYDWATLVDYKAKRWTLVNVGVHRQDPALTK